MKRNTVKALFIAFAVLGGCGHASSQTLRIDIAKLSYSTPHVEIHLGDTVEWNNLDAMAHTSTADANQSGGAWEVLIPPGKTASFQPSQVGSISYYCRFHPNMKGEIEVLP